jgi:protoporphyrinogen oxidase
MTTGILGGGALGLTLALRLAQQGERVVVFEREPVAGGLAAGFAIGDVFLEKFYHHLFRTDRAAIALIAELGLGERLVWRRANTSTLVEGHCYQLDGALPVLRFRPLPLLDRLRLGAVALGLRLLPDPRPLAQDTAAVWLRCWMGARAYSIVWEPQLRGKFGPYADQIAMPWFWARLHYRTARLGYLRGGFQQLYEALVAAIRAHGGEVRLGVPVARVTPLPNGQLRITTSAPDCAGPPAPTSAPFSTGMPAEGPDALFPNSQDLRPTTVSPSPKRGGGRGERSGWGGGPPAPVSARNSQAASGPERSSGPSGPRAGFSDLDCARVVSTLATRLTFRLIPDLPADFRAAYDWGLAYGAHCLILALDRPLTDSVYWLGITDPGYPFLALVEHTNYMPPEDYGGRHLVYLGNYLPMDHPLFGASTAEVMATFLPHLKRINPRFRAEWVRESWSFAAPFAQPIVTRDFARHIPPHRTPIPNLYLANMFQVYPQDRGQNYSIALANRLAQEIVKEGNLGHNTG